QSWLSKPDKGKLVTSEFERLPSRAACYFLSANYALREQIVNSEHSFPKDILQNKSLNRAELYRSFDAV
ncbi:hypothetical protein, partial [Photobacterium sp. OFAV2-7]|uniref:hypothetical protein n=1 Tax=Photobacterium sp. OFAV2-7 TaxID=2917748 RepID=UPI001EF4BB2B